MKTVVEKGWGREIIFADNDMYCGKLLVFNKSGSESSMHYHLNKHETWYVQKGLFQIEWIETKTATVKKNIVKEGDTWVNIQGFPHRLIALENDSVIFEVSTPDDEKDSYRVSPGDSQR
jgi:mannose-6-phosphate isomerase-like protein (cupin superfamily)